MRDIYTGRSRSEHRTGQQLPPPSDQTPTAAATMLSPPSGNGPVAMPEISPMRRGRPTKAISHHGSAQPSPSPLRMIDPVDPFASLDKGKMEAADELSSRFPTLDQFSLLSEKGKKFDFEPPVAGKMEPEETDLSRRVLNALADEAFARPPSPERPAPTKTAPPLSDPSSRVALDRKISYEVTDAPRHQNGIVPPVTQKPTMVSIGTMTSPSPPPFFDDQPIHRFPTAKHVRRPSSLPRSSEASRPMSGVAASGSRLSNLLSQDAAKSQLAATAEPKPPSTSRRSLESTRPSILEPDSNVSRSKPTAPKMRPVSMNAVSKQELYRGRRPSKPTIDPTEPLENELPTVTAVESDTNITSDVEFLRSKEEEEKAWKVQKRHSSGHGHKKRASLASISLSGTKSLLAGRFGDAFRKFEGGNTGPNIRSQSPSPSEDPINVLTPIAGSEATDLSDERHGFEETEDLSPETRRELERRRLSAEERRVANAAAEYRMRLAGGGERGRDPTRAVSIQYKVQSLLKENDRPATKTAAGYGRFTDSDASPQMKQFETQQNIPVNQPSRLPALQKAGGQPPGLGEKARSEPPSVVTSPSAVLSPPAQRLASRPTAPPKPKKMRRGVGEAGPQPAGEGLVGSTSAATPTDDWEANFSRRYPSLSGLEMVETEIDPPKAAATLRTKEV